MIDQTQLVRMPVRGDCELRIGMWQRRWAGLRRRASPRPWSAQDLGLGRAAVVESVGDFALMPCDEQSEEQQHSLSAERRPLVARGRNRCEHVSADEREAPGIGMVGAGEGARCSRAVPDCRGGLAPRLRPED